MTRRTAAIVIAAASTLAICGGPTGASTPPDSIPPTTIPPATAAPSTTTTTSSPTTSTAAPSTTAVPVATAEQWAIFDRAVSDRLVGHGALAAGVAVSFNGVPIHRNAFGRRTPDEPLDPTVPTDRFRLASISKMITATVVLELVADGVIDLDAPVGSIFTTAYEIDPPDPRWTLITPRQLLSHSAGIPKYRGEYFDGTFYDCGQAAGYALARPLERQPGTAHAYSNLNFCLLTLLIQHHTGMSYEAAVQERLFDPLGIDGPRLAGTIDPDPNEVVHISAAGRTYMEALSGAGSWTATPADVVRILDSLTPGTPGWHPLPSALADVMVQTVPGVQFPEPEKRTFGLGIIVWPDGSWGHTGSVENTQTIVAHRPDGVTFSILVSGTPVGGSDDLRTVFDEALAAAGISFARPSAPAAE